MRTWVLLLLLCSCGPSKQERLEAEYRVDLARCESAGAADRCSCLELAAAKWEVGIAKWRERPLTQAAKTCRGTETLWQVKVGK